MPLSRAFAEIVDPMPLGKMRESDAPARVFFTRAVPNGTTGMIGHGVLLALRGRIEHGRPEPPILFCWLFVMLAEPGPPVSASYRRVAVRRRLAVKVSLRGGPPRDRHVAPLEVGRALSGGQPVGTGAVAELPANGSHPYREAGSLIPQLPVCHGVLLAGHPGIVGFNIGYGQGLGFFPCPVD